MKKLPDILESMPDGRVALLTFKDGDCFGLSDFEMVDESIYERSDICLSNINSKIKVLNDVYSVGTKFEFSLNDVLKVEDAVSGDIMYWNKRNITPKNY